MDNYLDQPSTSNGPAGDLAQNEEKTKAMYEYVDEHGQTVYIEAPSSAIFVDEEGNTVICAQEYSDFAHEVVQEEIVGEEYEEQLEESRTNTNKYPIFKDSYPKSTVLLTNKYLDDGKATLIGKAGLKKIDAGKQNEHEILVNNDGSQLNRDLPGMKKLFKVVSEATMKKVDDAIKSEFTLDQKGSSNELEKAVVKDENSRFVNSDDDDDEQPAPLMDQYNNIVEQLTYHDEWPIYSQNEIDYKDACEILTGLLKVPNERVCTSIPLEYRKEGTFIIDMRSIPDNCKLLEDKNGKWGLPSGKVRFYKENKDGKLVRADDGKGNLKEWTKDFTFKVFLKRYENMETKNAKGRQGNFFKKVYTAITASFEKINYVVITYSWLNGNPWEFREKTEVKSKVRKQGRNWEKESIEKGNLTSLPSMVSAYFEGFTLYSHVAVDFNEASGILLGGTIVDSNKKCGSVPLGYRQNGTFVIDLKKMRHSVLELRRDDNGLWGKPSGFSRFYKFDDNGDAVRVDRAGKLIDGMDYDVKISCKRYEHNQVNKKFVRKIYIVKPKTGESFEGSPDLAIISYYWKGDPIPFEPAYKQNCVRNNKQYSQYQEMEDEDDEFVEATPAIGQVVDEDLDVIPGMSDSYMEPQSQRLPVTRKRQRIDEESEFGSQVDEKTIKMRLLRKEMENQERFSAILDRTESLLGRLENRFADIEEAQMYENVVAHEEVWDPNQQILEEEQQVMGHEMPEY